MKSAMQPHLTPCLTSRSTFSAWNVRALVPLALGVLSLTMASPALAQERMLRTLTVTGQGTESIQTTLTQVSLGVEVQGRTAAAAQQEAARRSTAVVEFLRSRNVQKLQTTGINLSPRYNYDNGDQRLVGYTAINTVSFELPTDQIGNILDEAVNAGATRIDRVGFIATEEAIAAAQREALREATQEARQQADVVLEALGLSAQGVVGVQINGATPPAPPPIFMEGVAMRQSADASTPVIGGEQEVQASVTLQISY